MTPVNLTDNSAVQTGVNFLEKKERLQEILFGPKDYAKDDEIVTKGTYLIFIIKYMLFRFLKIFIPEKHGKQS